MPCACPVRLPPVRAATPKGDFGTFPLNAKADGSDSAEEVAATHIKDINVRFTPGKEFKDAISRATFEKL